MLGTAYFNNRKLMHLTSSFSRKETQSLVGLFKWKRQHIQSLVILLCIIYQVTALSKAWSHMIWQTMVAEVIAVERRTV